MNRRKNNKNNSYTTNNVRLVRGGSEYFRILIDLLDVATDTIHIQTYIYEADETGNLVAEALIRAAVRNVKVYMLVDGYASQALPSEFITKLLEAGIHFRFFEPIFKSRHFYFGRRLHSKVVVVDSRCALVGGVNITNRYNDMPGEPAWLDFALLAEGPIAAEACRECWKLWKGLHTKRSHGCVPAEKFPGDNARQVANVRMRRNDWVRNKLQISNSYLEMFRTSKWHITILSSYALPGNVFRKNLQRAVRRGVKVRMIISGRSDVPLVKQAERYWYAWLVRNNIDIYEYTKNVLHGKLAVCDSEWMTIGSYNVNDLSAYASIELNFDVSSRTFVTEVEHVLDTIVAEDCQLISKEKMAEANNWFDRFGRWISYQIIRASFNLFTFYYRQRK